MSKGILVVISGPSGTGKGTICTRILDEMDNMEFSTSMTTRQPRDGETDGKDYFFVTKDQFEAAIDNDEFLEYAQVFGNYYGTPKQAVASKLEEGKDILLDIDVQGAMNVKRAFPDELFIFILPPSMEELRRRITGRGTDSEEAIERRLSQAESEMSLAEEYNYQIVNDDLETAVSEVKRIIRERKETE